MIRKKYAANKGITLVLGGGGARGIAHLGVLRVLQREKISIARIVGSSMGSVIGAMYSQHPDAEWVYKRFIKTITGKEFKSSGLFGFVDETQSESRLTRWLEHAASSIRIPYMPRVNYSRALVKSGIFDEEIRDTLIEQLIDQTTIEQTVIPFTAVATDLISGHGVAISTGDIRKAVGASMSIPGFFPPVLYRGKLLVDGGVAHPVPVRIAKKISKGLIVAVDVGKDIDEVESLKYGFSIVMRAEEIGRAQLARLEAVAADIVIRPPVGTLHWSEFHQTKTIVDCGQQACEQTIPELLERINRA